MKKLLLTTMTSLTISFGNAQTTACDSLTITGSQYQLQITANNLNTFIYYWETSGSDGTIIEQDTSMNTTHSVFNINPSTGLNYDTLITCISTINTYCCAILVWDGNNWINTSGSNPPPPPLNCNANFYWWQDFDSTNNAFTNQVYCVENSTGGTGPFSYNWVFGDGNTSNLQYPTHIYNQVGDYNLCLTYTDANGCSSVYCDTITISSRSSGYTLNVIDESQIATLDIEKMEIISGIKIFPNPTKEDITISTNNFNEKINTEVYDLIGNKLQTTNKTTISLRDYARGIYILNVAYGDRVEEVKVIKE